MFKKISKCRVCNSLKLKTIIDLGDQPPANSLKSKKIDQKKIPLVLMFCTNCKLIQLNTTVSPKALFSKYLWVTGTSEKIKNYRDYFVKKVLSYNSGNKVFEIASNDGFFLKKFKSNRMNVLGVDPAKNIAKKANKSQIKTIPKFFNSDVAKEVSKKYGSQDVIICRNVIPHVENIHSVIKGISNLMHNQSNAFIEFHYAKLLSNKQHYDYIYHEHVFYYTLQSLMYLLKKHNLYAYDCFTSPISGGSLVLVISKKKKTKKILLSKKINLEKKDKINTLKFWKSFEKKCFNHRNDLTKLIYKILEKKNTIAAYGASARSSTLLNYCGLNDNHIDVVFDKNLLKSGLYTAGSNIKILTPSINKINNYKYILLLAWNFSEEIIKYLKKEVKYKGSIINVLPKISLKKCK